MRGSSNTATEWWEQQERTLRGGRPPRIEVFLRSLSPPIGARGQQRQVLEQLSTFENDGVVESVTTTVWGKAICPDSQATRTTTGERILDRVEEFRSWADDAEAPIDLPFRTETVSSSVTDEQFRKLVLPRLCLAVYTGDTLEFVLPCDIGDETVRIDDLLRTVRRQAPDGPEIGTSV